MMSGMLLASALLSFQLDKIYAQLAFQVDITASVPPCTIDQNEDELNDELDCAASDGGAILTRINPPFDLGTFGTFDLDCEHSIEDDDEILEEEILFDHPLETTPAISCDLEGDDWNAWVTCHPPFTPPFTTRINSFDDCYGGLVPPNEIIDGPG
jgi:hypothetical protein